MAITTSSAKIQFNVGSFDYQTGLDLPSVSKENTLVFKPVGFLSDSLGDFHPPTTTNGIVDVLFRVIFAGNEIYKHPQFDTNFQGTPFGSRPSSPDFSVDVEWSFNNPTGAVDETVTQDFILPLPQAPDGTPAKGTYQVTAKYVYSKDEWAGKEDLAEQTVTYQINFDTQPKTPNVSFWYDTQIPILKIEDNTVYQAQSSTVSTDTEFTLYPPLSGVPITQVESVPFTSFGSGDVWVGSNELEYTILVTVNSGIWEVVYADQVYAPILIYKISRCSIYSCIRSFYNKWRSCPCGTKQSIILDRQATEINLLAQMLTLGLGCEKEDYSKLIERFNALTGSQCACLDVTPEQLF